MMIDSKKYKGIEYVQLDELPVTQQEKLRQTINRDLLIKIMIDGKIINDCLQFKDYSFWFHSVYRPQAVSVADAVKVDAVQFDANRLALSNS
jgi:hypothetical protein